MKRPGHFIKEYLQLNGEAAIGQIHQAFKADIDLQNESRDRTTRLSKPTWGSFYQYFRHFVFLGLVEICGEESIEQRRRFSRPAAPEKMGFVERVDGELIAHEGISRRLWRLTPAGESEGLAWDDPIKARDLRVKS